MKATADATYTPVTISICGVLTHLSVKDTNNHFGGCFWYVPAVAYDTFRDIKLPHVRCPCCREKQLRLWCDMVLRWHNSRNEYVFEWRNWPLWENAALGRKLSKEGARAVVEKLIQTGHAEWNDSGQSMVTLMWHSAEEIAAKLFDFVKKHDMIGGVFTVYELHQGDDVLGTDFFGMDEGLFRKALSVLENQGRAVLFKGATSAEDGVKFIG
ncbi:unnamed protein product [Scytosiphon promiscuus]